MLTSHPSSPSRGASAPSGRPAKVFSRSGWIGVAGLAALLLGAGLVYLSDPFAAARRELAKSLGTIAALSGQQLAEWRHERLGDAAVIARAPGLPEYLRRPEAAGADSALGKFLEQARISYRYEAITVFDRTGKTVLALPAGGAEPTPAPLAAGRRAEAGSAQRIGELRRGPDGRLDLEINSPVRDPDTGEILGGLVFRIDPETSLFPILQKWPLPHRTGEVVLLRKQGAQVEVLSRVRKLPDPPLTLRLALTGDTLPAAALVGGSGGGVGEGLDYDGEPALGLIREIPEFSWLLLAKVDADEAYEPARSKVMRVILGLALALALVGAVLRSIWQRRRRAMETERLQAESARQDLALRLGLIMQQANDGIVLLDAALKIRELNERAAELHGWEAGAMTGVDWREYFPAVSGSPDLAEAFGSPESATSRVFEAQIVRRDGSPLPVEISSRWATIQGDAQLVCVVRDVSEREGQRRRVARINQLYQVLSHVNQAIVRAADSEELCREICRICVEIGGFRMAWIGWIDPGNGTVVPAVQCGDTTGYLDGIRIPLADAAGVAGPSARSIGEGRPTVTQDFMQDPSTRPWWDRARAAGVRSSISIPLRRGGRVAGTLAVYAGEPGVFGAEEVGLLVETAGDVSFAHDVFDRDAARRVTETALRESQSRLEFLVSETPVVIYSLAPGGDGAMTFVSRNVEQILGWTAADFLAGRGHWVACVHPDDREAAEIAGRGLRADRPVVREYRLRRKNGEYCWLHDEMRLVTAAGQPREITGVWTDVTARKEAEQALRESEARHRSLFESMDFGVVYQDLTGTITAANPAATRILGLAVPALQGRTSLDPVWRTIRENGSEFPGDEHPSMEALRTGRRVRGVMMGLRQETTGEVRWIEVDAVPEFRPGAAQPFRVVAVFADVTARVLAAAELRVLSLAVEQNPVSILITDPSGAIEYANPRLTAVTGYSPAELRGQTPRVFKSGLTPPDVYADMWRTITGGGTWRGEVTNCKKNGDLHLELVVIAPVTDAAGRPTHFVAIKEDITERRRIDDELRASEESYRLIAENTLDMIWLGDLRTGTLLYVSPASLRLHGCSPEDLVGRPMAERQTPAARRWFEQDLPARVAAFEAGDDAARHRTYESELLRNDGTAVAAEIVTTLMADAGGRAVRILGVTRDMTERKRSEESLRKLSRIIEQAPLSVAITDLNGAIEYINPHFTRVTGYTPADLKGRNPRLLKSGGTPDHVYREMWETLTAGQVWRGELHNRKKNGEVYVEEAVIAPVVDEAGKVSHYVALKQDVTERKRTEQALAESQARYRLIAEHTDDVIWLYDLAADRFEYVSPSVYKLRGYTPEEVVGRRMADALTPESQAAVAAQLPPRLAAYAAGDLSVRTQVHEVGQFRRDGGIVVTEVVTTLLREGTGPVTGILGVTRDITERKAAENRLQDLVQELQALHGVATAMEQPEIGRDELLAGLVRYLPAALRFPAEARALIVLDGKEYAAGATGEWADRLEAPVTINGRVAGAVSLGYTGAVRRPDEGGFTASDRAVVGSIARTIGLGLGSRESFAAVQRFNAELEDKVAQRTAELEARNREVQALLQSIPDMVVRMRTDGTPLHCQYAKGESPLARICADTENPAAQAGRRELELTVLETGRRAVADAALTAEGEAMLECDGAALQLELRAARVAPDEFVAFVRDITARKRLEAEIAATLEKERQVSEMKTRFISVTSHEFRTPMAAAVGTVELLRNHFDRLAPAKRDEMFGRITGSLHRMTEMLDDLLLLNRMEAGRMQAAWAPLDLAAFLREAVDEARMADGEAHRFATEVPPGPVPFTTDPNLLHHIVSNLLANAARYSAAGTAVTASLETTAEGATVTVRDRGIGIPAPDRARIFQPFERGSNVGNIKGTGLGLSIVKRMTEMLGGTIVLTSPADGGSCFTLVLPSRPPASPP